MIDRLVPQQAAAQLLANRLVFGQLYNVDMNYWIGSKSAKPFGIPGNEPFDMFRYPQPAINTRCSTSGADRAYPVADSGADNVANWQKANIPVALTNVRFVPQADSCTAAILSHVVGVAQRGQGRVPLRFSGGISIDKNFKIDAAQQLHTVVCFNFSLFHLCHTLVNSSSRSRDQIEQIL
ncbi:MAG: hypothetical protein WB689_18475 [Xanthobacteraceae bacterium]